MTTTASAISPASKTRRFPAIHPSTSRQPLSGMPEPWPHNIEARANPCSAALAGDEKTVQVLPSAGAWLVHAPGLEPICYTSGAQAEAAARQLAAAWGRQGVPARVIVHDQMGRYVGAFVYARGGGMWSA